MSLINDALKRAKQAQKNNPAPPPALQFRAADPAQRQNSGRPILLIVVVVFILTLIGFFTILALQKPAGGKPVVNLRQPDADSVRAIAPASVAPAPNPVRTAEPAPATAQPKLSPPLSLALRNELAIPTNSAAAAPAIEVTTNATVAPADIVPPKPALPKLQGIFYRPERPSAVINGKNVFVGGRVGDFQVLAITQESVTLGSATQTNVLSLGE